MSFRRLRLFLDANILHAAALRDFFLRLAEAGAIDVFWSRPVIEETRRSLEGRGFSADKLNRVIAALELAFPEAEVQDFGHLIARMDCPDPHDGHVLAAAVAAEADVLVTNDRSGFPSDTLERHDLLVLTGDEAAAFLVESYQESAVEAARQQIADLANPPYTEEQFLDRVAKTAPRFAVALGARLGIEPYVQLAQDAEDVVSHESPQEAVEGVLAALWSGSEDDVWLRLHPTFQQVVLAAEGDRPAALLFLRRQLADTRSDGWAFASAKRLAGADAELVKLVNDAPLIVRRPMLVQQAHLFRMVHVGDVWLLAGLDEPDPAFEYER